MNLDHGNAVDDVRHHEEWCVVVVGSADHLTLLWHALRAHRREQCALRFLQGGRFGDGLLHHSIMHASPRLVAAGTTEEALARGQHLAEFPGGVQVVHPEVVPCAGQLFHKPCTACVTWGDVLLLHARQPIAAKMESNGIAVFADSITLEAVSLFFLRRFDACHEDAACLTAGGLLVEGQLFAWTPADCPLPTAVAQHRFKLFERASCLVVQLRPAPVLLIVSHTGRCEWRFLPLKWRVGLNVKKGSKLHPPTLRAAATGARPDLLHAVVTEYEAVTRVLELECHLRDRGHAVPQQQPTTSHDLFVSKGPELFPKVRRACTFCRSVFVRGTAELLEHGTVKAHVRHIDCRVRLMRELSTQLRPRPALFMRRPCDKAGRRGALFERQERRAREAAQLGAVRLERRPLGHVSRVRLLHLCEPLGLLLGVGQHGRRARWAATGRRAAGIGGTLVFDANELLVLEDIARRPIVLVQRLVAFAGGQLDQLTLQRRRLAACRRLRRRIGWRLCGTRPLRRRRRGALPCRPTSRWWTSGPVRKRQLSGQPLAVRTCDQRLPTAPMGRSEGARRVWGGSVRHGGGGAAPRTCLRGRR
eukprot:1035389-Prymnesium_polylepis.1